MKRIAVGALLMAAGLYSLALLIPQFAPGGYRPDFSVFWAAVQALAAGGGQLYDAQALTTAQEVLVGRTEGLRPFAYPPSALLLFLPFGALPYVTALCIWILISLLAFGAAARAVVGVRATALALISPPLVLAAATGQTSLLVGAAATSGLFWLDRRPWLAGALLGAAAMIKPQALILLPVALIAGRYWRSLAAAAATALLMFLLTLLLWGPALWRDWLHALQGFLPIVAGLGLARDSIALASLAQIGGWPAPAGVALQLVAGIGGAVYAFRVFRQPEPWPRLMALLAGSLFCAPYALVYDLAPLMPLAAALIMTLTARGLAAGLAFTSLGGAATIPLLIFSGLTARPSDRTAQPGPANGRDDQQQSAIKGAE